MSEQKRTTGALPNITPDFNDASFSNAAPPPSRRASGGGGGAPPGGGGPPLPEPDTDWESRQRRAGTGCGFVMAITLLLAGGLALVGLLLPPINLGERLFGTRYVVLTREANAIREATLTIAVYGEDVGDNFAVALSSVSQEEFATGGDSEDGSIRTAFSFLPTGSIPVSPLFSMNSTGTPPEAITISLTLTDPDIPSDLLDLYGYTPDSGWRFIPSTLVDGVLVATVSTLPDRLAALQAATDEQVLIVSVDVDEVLSEDVAALSDVLLPAGLRPTAAGGLTGSLAAGFDLAQRYLVLPAVRNYSDARATDPETIAAILRSRELTNLHLVALIGLARSGYDGVALDYRDLPEDIGPLYVDFLTQLGTALRAEGKVLLVVIPAAVNTPEGWQTGAYDWQRIGAVSDAVVVTLPDDPAAYAPGADRLVEAMVRWGTDQISRQKLNVGMSALSQRQVGDGFTPVSLDEALSALGNVTLDATLAPGDTLPPGTPFTARLDGFPAAIGAADDQPYIDYLDQQGGTIARAWVMNGHALRTRIDRLSAFGLIGVMIDDLNSTGLAPDVLPALLDFSLNLPAQPTPFALEVEWTIERPGSVVDTLAADLNSPIAVTLEPEGRYAVNAQVVSSGVQGDVGSDSAVRIAREGAQIAVFSATATPTPTPTPTPTLTPTPLPTNAPVQPSAPSGGGQPAFQPGAGSIRVGTFEYGGHVTSTQTNAVGAMQRAGMTWMKVQLRYGVGADPSIAGTWISQARGAGFKILIGIVGNPGELAAGGAGYLDQFAAFAGAVAGQGPDAIEVWNEANLDREWPNGQISGAAYADLLARAYQSIKAANGSVLVISAAPAPTGAEAAYPGAVVNDDNWMRQFVEAGGLNTTDCVGVHYNEGTVPASATSGDRRDNYYTRYLPTMLDVYWNIVGGAKPLCFTELGYLTPEGYPPLDPYFGWASETTVAQQAAWLAEAAAYLSQSGRVRLMIVWNVDYEFYGADPMAGFAIVRPGGGCPACDALAAAR